MIATGISHHDFKIIDKLIVGSLKRTMKEKAELKFKLYYFCGCLREILPEAGKEFKKLLDAK